MAAPYPTPIADALRAHGWKLYRTPVPVRGEIYVFVVSPGGRWGVQAVRGASIRHEAIEAGFLRAARRVVAVEGAIPLWMDVLQPLGTLPDLDARLVLLEVRLVALGWGEERRSHIVRQLAAEFEV